MEPDQDVVRLPKPRDSSPRSLVNDDLGSLDSHVPDGVVPIANAQESVSKRLDQRKVPFSSVSVPREFNNTCLLSGEYLGAFFPCLVCYFSPYIPGQGFASISGTD